MVGADVLWRSSKKLTDAVEDLLKEGKGLFDGLKIAKEPCSIDGLFLEGGGLTPFSRSLLIFSYDAYKAYANKWEDVAKELEELKDKSESRGGIFVAEEIYAIGLAILLAGARAAGRNVNDDAVKTALWLSGFSVQRVANPWAVDFVINLLYPLRDLHKSGWAYLISKAVHVMATKRTRGELNAIYEDVRGEEEWVKARMAVTYAKRGIVDKACSLLNEVKDDLLRMVTETYVYYYLTQFGISCPNVDACKELENFSQSLEHLEEQVSSNPNGLLEEHQEFRKYLEWRSVTKPEEALGRVIKEVWVFALLGLVHCALLRGEFNTTPGDYNRKISCELQKWVNYLREGAAHVTVAYLRKAAHALVGYLITLALAGRREEVEKLLEEYGLFFLGQDKKLSVAARLVLKYLGLSVETPSGEEVLEAVMRYVKSVFLPALAEILGAPIIDAPVCMKFEDLKDDKSCIAYMAVKGNKEAEESIRQYIVTKLSKAGVPPGLLEKASVRQLVEVYALRASRERFILLLRALVSGDRDLALLHAEVGRVNYVEFPGKLFGELADALRSGNEYEVKLAVAKLYYYHF